MRYVRIDPGCTVVILTLLPLEYPWAISCHRLADGIHWCSGIRVPAFGAGVSVPTTVITPLVASVVRMLEIFAFRAGAVTGLGAAAFAVLPRLSALSPAATGA